jgi:hypothetical protein
MTSNADSSRKRRRVIFVEVAVLALCIFVGFRFGPRKLELAGLLGLAILALFWGASTFVDPSPRLRKYLRYRPRDRE